MYVTSNLFVIYLCLTCTLYSHHINFILIYNAGGHMVPHDSHAWHCESGAHKTKEGAVNFNLST